MHREHMFMCTGSTCLPDEMWADMRSRLSSSNPQAPHRHRWGLDQNINWWDRQSYRRFIKTVGNLLSPWPELCWSSEIDKPITVGCIVLTKLEGVHKYNIILYTYLYCITYITICSFITYNIYNYIKITQIPAPDYIKGKLILIVNLRRI